EPELRPIEDLDVPMKTVTSERRWWVAPADEDEPPPLRDLGDRLRQDVVQGAIGWRVLVVVEDDREGQLQPAIELAKEPPGKLRDAPTALGRQQRQRPAAAGCGQTQVVEEGRDVGVALIDPVPEPAGRAGGKVGRDQGRLTRARRSPHPG